MCITLWGFLCVSTDFHVKCDVTCGNRPKILGEVVPANVAPDFSELLDILEPGTTSQTSIQ